MAETSSIEWTEATWNPITGCTLVSDGCRHCYAARLAATRLKHHPSRKGLARLNAAGEAKFTGEVRFNEEWLDQPLRWTRPRMIFVCAHGDLFHESVPDEWIDRVFAVMALAPQHTFQVLTKRSKRMREYIDGTKSRIPYLGRMPLERVHLEAAGHMEGDGGFMDVLKKHGNVYSLYLDAPWPLPNVWLGVSAEDQETADERIPDLLATPATIRFVSAEPLLGPIDFTNIGAHDAWEKGALAPMKAQGWSAIWKNNHIGRAWLDQIIVGGESGANARPMHPDWARSIRDQCKAADVAFFFKQWGSHRPLTPAEHGQACGATLIGDDPHDRDAYVLPVTKKAAGRLLDGVEHNGMPAPMEIPAL